MRRAYTDEKGKITGRGEKLQGRTGRESSCESSHCFLASEVFDEIPLLTSATDVASTSAVQHRCKYECLPNILHTEDISILLRYNL
ncbi:hypothetical protein EJB05_45716, partial [Eragrostis curvula]